MFLTCILRYIIGFADVWIEGELPEKFLNYLSLSTLRIWGICRKNGHLHFKIACRDFKKIKPYAQKSNVTVHIDKKRGLPFKLFRYRKRWGLFLGGIIFIILVYFMCGYVWNIEIKGNNVTSTEDIKTVLKEEGLYEGCAKGSLNLRRIRENARGKLDNVAHIELNIKGCYAYVKITDGKIKKQLKSTTPSNLIASRDGVIKSMEITGGIPIAKVDDTVLKGQILVSGIIDSTVQGFFTVPSSGKVMAQFNDDIEVFVPFKQTIYSRTGEKKKKNSIKFFNFSFNLFLKGGIDYEFYDKIDRETTAKIFNTPIPLTLFETTYYEKTAYEEEISKEKCKSSALTLLENTVREEYGEAEVTAQNIQTRFTDEGCYAKGSYIITDDIAALKELDVKN